MMALLSSPQQFWIPLAQIIGINIVLSGDNAVVIALASRSLHPSQQKKAIVFGSAAAIIMRIGLTLTAVALLAMPYLKLIGAVLLVWIGIQLINGLVEDFFQVGVSLITSIVCRAALKQHIQ